MHGAHPWGEPLWKVEIEIADAPPPREVSVAIVGAGFTGLSAAVHLRRARPAWRVAVLEAAAVGGGASGRTGGLILDDTAAGPDPRFEGALASAAELIAAERIACDLQIGGCWEVVHEDGVAGSPIAWTDEGQPLRAARLVAGGTLHPGRLVAGLARAALDAGVSVHERCPVTELDPAARPRLVTPRGVVTADWVVLASNGYPIGLRSAQRPAAPSLTLALATAPLDASAVAALGLGAKQPFYTVDLPYLWGRLTADDRLVLGSGLLLPERGDICALSIAAGRGPSMLAALEARMRKLHPALERAVVTHRWGGPIAITEDWLPILEEHARSPRVLVAGAYSGHGVAQSLRMGQLVAQRIDAEAA